MSNFAGGGAGGGTDYVGDGLPADSAIFNNPTHLTFDKFGNFYIVDALGNRIRKVDTAGIITTVAGTGHSGYNGDGGLADTSKLNGPGGIACDSVGNIYIADDGNNRIRKVEISTGIITTIAGDGTGGYNGDSILASSAMLNSPNDICFDKFGNLYVSDVSNIRIRKINAAGIITTCAGNGIMGNSGDYGLATEAKIEGCRSLTTDYLGNLYFAEWGTGGDRIRTIDTSGIIHTIAGTGLYVYNGDDLTATMANIDPDQITFDKSGNLVLGDYDNNIVRRIDVMGVIHTIAGNTIEGDSGDGGPADLAEFDGIGGIAFDDCGNLYISQVNSPRIRKVTFDISCRIRPNGINSFSTAQYINIYPNPTNDLLYINLSPRYATYTLTNAIGAAIRQGQLNTGNNSIDMRSLPSGIYMLQVAGEGYRTVQKVVKE